MISISRKEKKALESKAKVGWFLFYRTNEELHDKTLSMRQKIQDLEAKLKNQSSIESVPVFLQNEMKELLTELDKSVQCPICLDDLDSSQLKFSSCGHKYCAGCLPKIDNCAVCRKKIYRKN